MSHPEVIISLITIESSVDLFGQRSCLV